MASESRSSFFPPFLVFSSAPRSVRMKSYALPQLFWVASVLSSPDLSQSACVRGCRAGHGSSHSSRLLRFPPSLSTASVSLPNTPSFSQSLYCIKQKIYGLQIWQSKTPHPFVSSPDILLPTSRTILVDQLSRTWDLTPVLCCLQPCLWTHCLTSLYPTLSPERRRL